jgi:hypothetical protein
MAWANSLRRPEMIEFMHGYGFTDDDLAGIDHTARGLLAELLRHIHSTAAAAADPDIVQIMGSVQALQGQTTAEIGQRVADDEAAKAAMAATGERVQRSAVA